MSITHMGFKSARKIQQEMEIHRVNSVEGIAQVLVEKHTVGFSVEKFDAHLNELAAKYGLSVLEMARNARLAILQEFHFLRGVNFLE